MNTTLRFLVAGLLCLPWLLQAAPKPNILFIMADDIGWGDFQCYNPQGKIPSPNIDRLAREGMRFTDAHTPGRVVRAHALRGGDRQLHLARSRPRRHVGLEPDAAVPARPEDGRPLAAGGRLPHGAVRQAALRRRVRDAARRTAGLHETDEDRADPVGLRPTPTCCSADTRRRLTCSSRTTASPATRRKSRNWQPARSTAESSPRQDRACRIGTAGKVGQTLVEKSDRVHRSGQGQAVLHPSVHRRRARSLHAAGDVAGHAGQRRLEDDAQDRHGL